MRIVIGLLAVTAACGDDGGMLPVGGGGNDGGFNFPDAGPRADARPDGTSTIDGMVAPIDANLLVGRVCLLTDVRVFTSCASTGAGGLTVRLGSDSTTTSDDGTFTIAGQTSGVWRITGPNIVTSVEVLADYFIPAILKSDFDAMRTDSAGADIIVYPGEGSMMVYASRNGAGVSGVTASTTPPGYYQPFYDGSSELAFTQTSTSTNGIIWVPGIDVGNATLTLALPGNPQVTAPILDGAITFANIVLP